MDEHGIDINDPGFQSDVVKAFIHRDSELAVLIAFGCIVERAAQQHSVCGIGKRRLRAGSGAKRQIHAGQNKVGKQVAASRQECGRKRFHQKLQGNARIRVGDFRFAQQCGNIPAGKVFCNRLDFAGYILGCRIGL